MSRYAIVVIVDAQQPEEAWEIVGDRLLQGDRVESPVAYIGAPWLVPCDVDDDSIQFETDSIRLRLNGKRVSLRLAD